MRRPATRTSRWPAGRCRAPCAAHLMAIYGYARLVDDLGDEAEGDRVRAAGLGRARAGRSSTPGEPRAPAHAPPRRDGARLRPAARPAAAPDRRQPPGPGGHALQRPRRAGLAYCRLSAAPGRSSSCSASSAARRRSASRSADRRVRGPADRRAPPGRAARTALRGRVYLPQADLARCGCSDPPTSTTRSPAPRCAVRWSPCEARTRSPAAGRGSAADAHAAVAPGLAVAGFVAGGRAALGRARAGGLRDVLGQLAAGVPDRGRRRGHSAARQGGVAR